MTDTHELVSADTHVNSIERDQELTLPPRPVLVHLAFAFTLVYTAIHVYWAVGGTWGLPPAALANRSAVQAANWFVSAIMVFGAFFVLALNHAISRRVPAWIVLVPIWIGAVVCVSHSIFGFVTKALYLSGVHGAVDFPTVRGVSPATAAEKNHLAVVQDLVVFEPCFLVLGVLLALAAWQFIRTPVGRRTWSVSIVVGVALIDVFGAVLSLAGTHVAIS